MYWLGVAANAAVEAVVEPHGFTIARARARVLIAGDHADSVVTLTVLLIAVTAWSIFEPGQQAVEAGVDQYATKPMDLEALSSLLSALAE